MLQSFSVEKQCAATIDDILKKNDLRRNTEMLMDQIEKDQLAFFFLFHLCLVFRLSFEALSQTCLIFCLFRKEVEGMLEIKHEEAEMLRKRDVLNAMQTMVLADTEIQHLYESYFKQGHDSPVNYELICITLTIPFVLNLQISFFVKIHICSIA